MSAGPTVKRARVDDAAAPLFKWTPSTERAAELKAGFDEEGYVHIRAVLKEHELAQVRVKIEEVIASLDGIPAEHQYYDVKGDPGSLKQIQRLHRHSGFFKSFAGEGRMAAIASTLLGEGAVLQNIQYFNKPPKTSMDTPAHQDGFYFHIKPNKAVTMWMALDAADEENGCLVYTTGSHKTGIRPHQASGVLGFSQKCTDYGTEADVRAEKAMEADPGDLVAHNSVLLHRAGRNHSETRQRRAVGFIYFAESAKEDLASAAAYQTMLHEQLKVQGRI